MPLFIPSEYSNILNEECIRLPTQPSRHDDQIISHRLEPTAWQAKETLTVAALPTPYPLKFSVPTATNQDEVIMPQKGYFLLVYGVKFAVWWKLLFYSYHYQVFYACGPVYALVYPIVTGRSSCCVVCVCMWSRLCACVPRCDRPFFLLCCVCLYVVPSIH
jgi:hypothetical protein